MKNKEEKETVEPPKVEAMEVDEKEPVPEEKKYVDILLLYLLKLCPAQFILPSMFTNPQSRTKLNEIFYINSVFTICLDCFGSPSSPPPIQCW